MKLLHSEVPITTGTWARRQRPRTKRWPWCDALASSDLARFHVWQSLARPSRAPLFASVPGAHHISGMPALFFPHATPLHATSIFRYRRIPCSLLVLERPERWSVYWTVRVRLTSLRTEHTGQQQASSSAWGTVRVRACIFAFQLAK